jgi:hypothetical protein
MGAFRPYFFGMSLADRIQQDRSRGKPVRVTEDDQGVWHIEFVMWTFADPDDPKSKDFRIVVDYDPRRGGIIPKAIWKQINITALFRLVASRGPAGPAPQDETKRKRNGRAGSGHRGGNRTYTPSAVSRATTNTNSHINTSKPRRRGGSIGRCGSRPLASAGRGSGAPLCGAAYAPVDGGG